MGSDSQKAESIPADRLAALRAAKLGALVRGQFGREDRLSESVGDLATLTTDHAAWVLVSGDATRRMGSILLWASKTPDRELHILADDGEGVLARRARAIHPVPSVWSIHGTTLVAAEPAELFDEDAVDVQHFASVFSEHDVDLEVEHGVAVGRVRGLEIARVIAEPEPHFQVGIGRFDREAGAMMRGGLADAGALASAAAEVRKYRCIGAERHPIGRLARERWLRQQIIESPSRVSCRSLSRVEPPLPELNLTDPAPASAFGFDEDGVATLVVVSTGIDPEIVAVAADLVQLHRPRRVVFALPDRDIVEPLRRSAAMLTVPAVFVAVVPEWEL